METSTETLESQLMKREPGLLESSSRAAVSICDDVEEMKELAKEGSGLTRFINDFQPGNANENVNTL